jgi:hypothetical protein
MSNVIRFINSDADFDVAYDVTFELVNDEPYIVSASCVSINGKDLLDDSLQLKPILEAGFMRSIGENEDLKNDLYDQIDAFIQV